MGRPKGADEEEPVLELSALERLFEGEADPTNPPTEEGASEAPAPSPGGPDA